jgi:hypothetical protein
MFLCLGRLRDFKIAAELKLPGLGFSRPRDLCGPNFRTDVLSSLQSRMHLGGDLHPTLNIIVFLEAIIQACSDFTRHLYFSKISSSSIRLLTRSRTSLSYKSSAV